METTERSPSRRGLSVAAKISLGFSIVLVLHISIAVLSHLGLSKAKTDLATYESLRLQVERFGEIDRVVGALQRNVLLFAFTGYQGPEVRAAELQDELERLLHQAETIDDDVEADVIEEMQSHLATHREIFEAVVVDRAKRRKLVNESLTTAGNDFQVALRQVFGSPTDERLRPAINSAFHAAQLHVMRFINSPDSAHVRQAKLELTRARDLLGKLSPDVPTSAAAVQAASQAVSDYEDALIQMVQATRGYLHLVNVVLAGESVEFRRHAGDVRAQQTNHIRLLAESMTEDTHRFQNASNLFAVLTIVLGVVAAWVIGRDVAPPLNAIANTIAGLARGETCKVIPGLGRRDELGWLASAAQVFKEKAAETERLLCLAKSSQAELNVVNQELANQTKLAESMMREAHAATRAKSEFLANMSHEIRSPMTAILGFAETIADNVDEGSKNAVSTIRRNGEHLLAIINDILDLSKVEAGEMTVESVDQSPIQLAHEVAALMNVKAAGAGISLEIEFRGQIPETICTDPTRLRQILINVVGNAIKFTEVGGVKLVVEFLPDERNPRLQFDVIDSGIGMTEEQTEKLFQPFSQADASMSRRFGGTGLGLTVSRRLAEMLGGDLTLEESERGVGSRFRLVIATGPLDGVSMIDSRDTRAARPTEHHSADDVDLTGCRLLLAEDGPDNQRLLCFVLKKAGAEVDLVENGQLAVEAALAAQAATEPFDCILMDMQMPVMDGYQATRSLRDQGYARPIVALTAHAMAGDEEKCLRAGCDGFLTKPIDRLVLLAQVAHWSRLGRAESAECASYSPSGRVGP